MSNNNRQKKQRTKPRRERRRKRSGGSIVSIDPYSLSLLKRASKHTRSMKTEMNIPKQSLLNNNNNNNISPKYKNNNKHVGFNMNNYGNNDIMSIHDEKQNLLSSETITVDELRPMIEGIAMEMDELKLENNEQKDTIKLLRSEKQQLMNEYEYEINNLKSDINDYKSQINDMVLGNTDFDLVTKQLNNDFDDKIKFINDNHKKEIDKLLKNNKKIDNELSQQYNITQSLRKSLEISEDDRVNLLQQINDLNKKLIKFKLIQKEKRVLETENNRLQDYIDELQNEMEGWANQAMASQQGSQRNVMANDLIHELGHIDSNNRDRDSVNLNNDENIQRIRRNSQESINRSLPGQTESQYINLADQLIYDSNNPNNNNNDNGYDSDQKTDEKEESNNNDDNISNKSKPKNLKIPTSWKQVIDSMAQKQKASSAKASIESNYDDSETNLEEKIDDIEEDVRRIKEMVTQILNETQQISPEINNNINPIKRQINRMFLMLNGGDNVIIDPSVTDIISDSESATTENSSNGIKQKKPGIKKRPSQSNLKNNNDNNMDTNSWWNWIKGDLIPQKLQPKKTVLEEWAPVVGFSVVILSVLYLIRKYRNGDITFGNPRVLRNTKKH